MAAAIGKNWRRWSGGLWGGECGGLQHGLRGWRGFDPGDEAVTAAGQSLDVLGIVGGVVQAFAQFVHGGVEAVIEVDEDVRRPKLGAEFLAGDELAGAMQEHGKDAEGLAGESEAD